jgi:hypothetical protein
MERTHLQKREEEAESIDLTVEQSFFAGHMIADCRKKQMGHIVAAGEAGEEERIAVSPVAGTGTGWDSAGEVCSCLVLELEFL